MFDVSPRPRVPVHAHDKTGARRGVSIPDLRKLMHHLTSAFAHSIRAHRQAGAAQWTQTAGPTELQELLLSAATRDNDAWTRLVKRFGPRIRMAARYEGLDSREAEDIIQSTWLELLKNPGVVREPAKLGAWLHTTARRESVRAAIAARRVKPVDDEVLLSLQPTVESAPSASAEGGGRLEAQQRSAALIRALQTLPERQRRMMHMLMIDPAPSYAEISAALDMPIGSIGPTRARCLERLRDDRELVDALAA
jgi:RNA polymerase sigma factor (sigma-70 family)